MQIRVTEIDTGKVMSALADSGLGMFRIENPLLDREGSPGALETASVWSDGGDEGPGDHQVGLLRRELCSFARHKLMLDTGRIPRERLVALLDRIAGENR